MGSAICGVLDDITVNVPVGKLGRPPRQMEAVSSRRLTYQNVPRELKSMLDKGLIRYDDYMNHIFKIDNSQGFLLCQLWIVNSSVCF